MPDNNFNLLTLIGKDVTVIAVGDNRCEGRVKYVYDNLLGVITASGALVLLSMEHVVAISIPNYQS